MPDPTSKTSLKVQKDRNGSALSVSSWEQGEAGVRKMSLSFNECLRQLVLCQVL